MSSFREIGNHQQRIKRQILDSFTGQSEDREFEEDGVSKSLSILDIEKGKAVPIGTISGKYQKVGPGKWVSVGKAAERRKTDAINLKEKISRAKNALKAAKTEDQRERVKVDIARFEEQLTRIGAAHRDTEAQKEEAKGKKKTKPQ